MPNTTGNKLVHPFCPGDRFDLPVPGIKYHPDHPLMKQMSDACTKNDLHWACWNHCITKPPEKIMSISWSIFLNKTRPPQREPHPTASRPQRRSKRQRPLRAFGLTPMLRAVSEAPLSTIQQLHSAGGSIAITVPFICISRKLSDYNNDEGRRLAVLRYVLDEGADPNAKKWAHNSRGYASDFDWGSGLNLALVGQAEELLRRGARTDVKTMNVASRGETVLELAWKYARGWCCWWKSAKEGKLMLKV